MMKINDIVKECAEGVWDVYSVYCGLIGEEVPEEYKDVPKWQQKALRDCVQQVVSGDMTGESISGEDLHSNWVVYMKDDGWQWGIEFDEEEQTHPELIGYDMLPVEQRCKAELLAAVICGVAASIIASAPLESDDEEAPDGEE